MGKLRRGHRPSKAARKVLTVLRLRPEVVALFKAGGRGWQSAAMVQRYAHLAPEHLSVHASRIETPLTLVDPVRTESGTGQKEKAA